MTTAVVPLADICGISMGQSPPSSTYNTVGNGLPFFQGKADFGDLYPIVRWYCDSPVRIAQPGDILLSVHAPVGPTNMVREESCIGRGLAALRPSDSLDRMFLLYFLRYHEPEISGQGRGSTFTAITRDDLELLALPLPGLAQQKASVARLNQAARLRNSLLYAFQATETLVQSAFIKQFADSKQVLDLCSVQDLVPKERGSIRTGPFGSQLLHSEFTDQGIAVLGIDNVVDNRFKWAKRRFIAPAKYEVLKRYTVHPGDVLITIMATCGRCAVVPDDIGCAINTKHLCCISLDQSLCLPTYLKNAFLYHPVVRQQLEVATKGAIMDGLNMEIIKKLRIPLPNLSQQESFAVLTDRHERLQSRQEEAVRQADHLFDTVLNATFALAT